jgi:hypothetical protein
MGVHIHIPRSARECEGMNPLTPKWSPTLGIKVLIESRIFIEQFERSKFIELIFFYTIGKLLRHRCLKWAHMIHLSIYNTSYG